MEIPQAGTGIEQTIGVQSQEQQGANPEETTTPPVDVVTISQEARNINTNTTETQNPTPAVNSAETARERDIAQIVQNNLEEETGADNQAPERADRVSEIV